MPHRPHGSMPHSQHTPYVYRYGSRPLILIEKARSTLRQSYHTQSWLKHCKIYAACFILHYTFPKPRATCTRPEKESTDDDRVTSSLTFEQLDSSKEMPEPQEKGMKMRFNEVRFQLQRPTTMPIRTMRSTMDALLVHYPAASNFCPRRRMRELQSASSNAQLRITKTTDQIWQT